MARLPRASRSPADEYFAPARPRVFAHRGLATEAPENTLLAFAHAVGVGADYIETDVQVSRDGVAIIAHDTDLTRVAGRELRVDQLTLAELRRIDLGHGQGFCSLTDALDAFPRTRFNIDVKAAGAVEPTIACVSPAGTVSEKSRSTARSASVGGSGASPSPSGWGGGRW